MKTFDQFLSESWHTRERREWRQGNRDGRRDNDSMMHTTQIHGHHVSIMFHHDEGHGYNVDYDVNGEIGREKAAVPKEHRQAILHHVNRTIGRFIRHVKPHTIGMSSFNPKKHSAYKKFAKHLAKKHGGVAQHFDYSGGGMSVVDFRKVNEDWSYGRKERKYHAFKGQMYHEKKVGPHKVTIGFSQDRPHHYGINYTVNGNMSSGSDVSDEHKHAILHHVHKTIDRFVRHRKPESITMSAADTTRHSLYKKFAHRLAKTHGGEAWHDDMKMHDFEGGYSGVNFRHHVRESLYEAVEKQMIERNGNVEHHFKVGDHAVRVRFTQHRRGRFTTNFQVNGSMDAPDNKNITNEHRHAIAHHVVGSIRHFLTHHNPEHLRAQGNTPKKQHLYSKMWKHIAKQHPDYDPVPHGTGLVRKGAKTWSEEIIEEGVSDQVHENPSMATLKAIAKNNRHGSARFVIAKGFHDDKHRLYAGDSYNYTHRDLNPAHQSNLLRGYVNHHEGKYHYRTLGNYSNHPVDHPMLRRLEHHGIENGNA